MDQRSLNDGPTLQTSCQHWSVVSCLLGFSHRASRTGLGQRPNVRIIVQLRPPRQRAILWFCCEDCRSSLPLCWHILKILINTLEYRDTASPANTRDSPKTGSMLAHRQRRWPNTEPVLGECLLFAGLVNNQKCVFTVCVLSKTNVGIWTYKCHGADNKRKPSYITMITTHNPVCQVIE